jgi:hypothetical protein
MVAAFVGGTVAILLMAENQDERVIWVVVELHRPKQRIRSRIVLHVGEYRNRDEAEAAFLERLAISHSLRAYAERWAVNAADVLSDRKARARFLAFGVPADGIAEFADDILRQREQDAAQARARARAALWSTSSPLAAFASLGLPGTATIGEIKAAYRRKAFQMHSDRGGDHFPRLNSTPRMRRPSSTPPGAADSIPVAPDYSLVGPQSDPIPVRSLAVTVGPSLIGRRRV